MRHPFLAGGLCTCGASLHHACTCCRRGKNYYSIVHKCETYPSQDLSRGLLSSARPKCTRIAIRSRDTLRLAYKPSSTFPYGFQPESVLLAFLRRRACAFCAQCDIDTPLFKGLSSIFPIGTVPQLQ